MTCYYIGLSTVLLQYVIVASLLFFNSCWLSGAIKYKSFKSSNGTQYLVLEHLKVIRAIPDQETYTEFFSDIPSNKHYDIDRINVPVYADFEINDLIDKGCYKLDAPVQSLKINGYNPDNLIQQLWNKVLTLSPLSFEDRITKLGYQNPSFTRWMNRTIGIWLPHSKDKKDHPGLRIDWLGDENIFFFDNASTTPTGFPSYSYTRPEYGIGGPIPFYYEKGLTNHYAERYLEDARLIVLNNNRLVISYALVRNDLGAEIKLHQVSATIINGTIQFSRPSRIEMVSEKNWCPFVSDGNLYYLRSLNPMHIVEIMEQPNNFEHGDDGIDEIFKIPVPKTIYKQASKQDLPWNPFYGDFLRGGTQAILVRGLYLGFFHTKQAVQKGFKLSTYFMGAFTLCPTFPFSIQSISPLPIMHDYWYTGPWVFPDLDYGVYPAGIILDEDQQHVWVLMGYQNLYMKLLRFNVDLLLKSLEVASNCSEINSSSSSSSRRRRSTSSDRLTRRRLRKQNISSI